MQSLAHSRQGPPARIPASGQGTGGTQGHSPRGCCEQRGSSNYAAGWRCQQDDLPCPPWARPLAPCSLCPSTWPATCPEPASLHLSSQCSSAPASSHSQAPAAPLHPRVPGLAGLGLEQLAPRWATGPQMLGLCVGATTWHPSAWASCPDQTRPGWCPGLRVPSQPRGVWSEHLGSPRRSQTLSRFSHLQTEDKSHDISKRATACLLGGGGTPPGLTLTASQPGASSPPMAPSAQLPPVLLTSNSCWPCPVKNLSQGPSSTITSSLELKAPSCAAPAVTSERPPPGTDSSALGWGNAGRSQAACSFLPRAARLQVLTIPGVSELKTQAVSPQPTGASLPEPPTRCSSLLPTPGGPCEDTPHGTASCTTSLFLQLALPA